MTNPAENKVDAAGTHVDPVGNKTGVVIDGAHMDISEKKQRVEEMFDNIAPTYDRLNHLLSFQIDRSWRRRTVRMAADFLRRNNPDNGGNGNGDGCGCGCGNDNGCGGSDNGDGDGGNNRDNCNNGDVNDREDYGNDNGGGNNSGGNGNNSGCDDGYNGDNGDGGNNRGNCNNRDVNDREDCGNDNGGRGSDSDNGGGNGNNISCDDGYNGSGNNGYNGCGNDNGGSDNGDNGGRGSDSDNGSGNGNNISCDDGYNGGRGRGSDNGNGDGGNNRDNCNNGDVNDREDYENNSGNGNNSGCDDGYNGSNDSGNGNNINCDDGYNGSNGGNGNNINCDDGDNGSNGGGVIPLYDAPDPRQAGAPSPVTPDPRHAGAPSPATPDPRHVAGSDSPATPDPRHAGAPSPATPDPRHAGAPSPAIPDPRHAGAPSPATPDPRQAGRIFQQSAPKRQPPLRTPKNILDVATGTGDLAIALARRIPDVRITGVDISENMLAAGRRKVAERGLAGRIELHTGDAEALDFPDGRFDCVTVAFGVRNFGDIGAGLRNMCRVVRPGGVCLVLEFSEPRGVLFGRIYRFYFSRVLPWLGRAVSRDKGAYTYLPRSVGEFPAPDDFAAMLHRAGFARVSKRRLTFGVAYIYEAVKNEASNGTEKIKP